MPYPAASRSGRLCAASLRNAHGLTFDSGNTVGATRAGAPGGPLAPGTRKPESRL